MADVIHTGLLVPVVRTNTSTSPPQDTQPREAWQAAPQSCKPVAVKPAAEPTVVVHENGAHKPANLPQRHSPASRSSRIPTKVRANVRQERPAHTHQPHRRTAGGASVPTASSQGALRTKRIATSTHTAAPRSFPPSSQPRAQPSRLALGSRSHRTAKSKPRKVAIIQHSPQPSDPRQRQRRQPWQDSADDASDEEVPLADGVAPVRHQHRVSYSQHPRKRAHLAPKQDSAQTAGVTKDDNHAAAGRRALRVRNGDPAGEDEEDDLLHMSSAWRRRDFIVRQVSTQGEAEAKETADRRAYAAVVKPRVRPASKYTRHEIREIMKEQKRQRAAEREEAKQRQEESRRSMQERLAHLEAERQKRVHAAPSHSKRRRQKDKRHHERRQGKSGTGHAQHIEDDGNRGENVAPGVRGRTWKDARHSRGSGVAQEARAKLTRKQHEQKKEAQKFELSGQEGTGEEDEEGGKERGEEMRDRVGNASTPGSGTVWRTSEGHRDSGQSQRPPGQQGDVLASMLSLLQRVEDVENQDMWQASIATAEQLLSCLSQERQGAPAAVPAGNPWRTGDARSDEQKELSPIREREPLEEGPAQAAMTAAAAAAHHHTVEEGRYSCGNERDGDDDDDDDEHGRGQKQGKSEGFGHGSQEYEQHAATVMASSPPTATSPGAFTAPAQSGMGISSTSSSSASQKSPGRRQQQQQEQRERTQPKPQHSQQEADEEEAGVAFTKAPTLPGVESVRALVAQQRMRHTAARHMARVQQQHQRRDHSWRVDNAQPPWPQQQQQQAFPWRQDEPAPRMPAGKTSSKSTSASSSTSSGASPAARLAAPPRQQQTRAVGTAPDEGAEGGDADVPHPLQEPILDIFFRKHKLQGQERTRKTAAVVPTAAAAAAASFEQQQQGARKEAKCRHGEKDVPRGSAGKRADEAEGATEEKHRAFREPVSTRPAGRRIRWTGKPDTEASSLPWRHNGDDDDDDEQAEEEEEEGEGEEGGGGGVGTDEDETQADSDSLAEEEEGGDTRHVYGEGDARPYEHEHPSSAAMAEGKHQQGSQDEAHSVDEDEQEEVGVVEDTESGRNDEGRVRREAPATGRSTARMGGGGAGEDDGEEPRLTPAELEMKLKQQVSLLELLGDTLRHATQAEERNTGAEAQQETARLAQAYAAATHDLAAEREERQQQQRHSQQRAQARQRQALVEQQAKHNNAVTRILSQHKQGIQRMAAETGQSVSTVVGQLTQQAAEIAQSTTAGQRETTEAVRDIAAAFRAHLQTSDQRQEQQWQQQQQRFEAWRTEQEARQQQREEDLWNQQRGWRRRGERSAYGHHTGRRHHSPLETEASYTSYTRDSDESDRSSVSSADDRGERRLGRSGGTGRRSRPSSQSSAHSAASRRARTPEDADMYEDDFEEAEEEGTTSIATDMDVSTRAVSAPRGSVPPSSAIPASASVAEVVSEADMSAAEASSMPDEAHTATATSAAASVAPSVAGPTHHRTGDGGSRSRNNSSRRARRSGSGVVESEEEGAPASVATGGVSTAVVGTEMSVSAVEEGLPSYTADFEDEEDDSQAGQRTAATPATEDDEGSRRVTRQSHLFGSLQAPTAAQGGSGATPGPDLDAHVGVRGSLVESMRRRLQLIREQDRLLEEQYEQLMSARGLRPPPDQRVAEASALGRGAGAVGGASDGRGAGHDGIGERLLLDTYTQTSPSAHHVRSKQLPPRRDAARHEEAQQRQQREEYGEREAEYSSRFETSGRSVSEAVSADDEVRTEGSWQPTSVVSEEAATATAGTASALPVTSVANDQHSMVQTGAEVSEENVAALASESMRSRGDATQASVVASDVPTSVPDEIAHHNDEGTGSSQWRDESRGRGRRDRSGSGGSGAVVEAEEDIELEAEYSDDFDEATVTTTTVVRTDERPAAVVTTTEAARMDGALRRRSHPHRFESAQSWTGRVGPEEAAAAAAAAASSSAERQSRVDTAAPRGKAHPRSLSPEAEPSSEPSVFERARRVLEDPHLHPAFREARQREERLKRQRRTVAELMEKQAAIMNRLQGLRREEERLAVSARHALEASRVRGAAATTAATAEEVSDAVRRSAVRHVTRSAHETPHSMTGARADTDEAAGRTFPYGRPRISSLDAVASTASVLTEDRQAVTPETMAEKEERTSDGGDRGGGGLPSSAVEEEEMGAGELYSSDFEQDVEEEEEVATATGAAASEGTAAIVSEIEAVDRTGTGVTSSAAVEEEDEIADEWEEGATTQQPSLSTAVPEAVVGSDATVDAGVSTDEDAVATEEMYSEVEEEEGQAAADASERIASTTHGLEADTATSVEERPAPGARHEVDRFAADPHHRPRAMPSATAAVAEEGREHEEKGAPAAAEPIAPRQPRQDEAAPQYTRRARQRRGEEEPGSSISLSESDTQERELREKVAQLERAYAERRRQVVEDKRQQRKDQLSRRIAQLQSKLGRLQREAVGLDTSEAEATAEAQLAALQRERQQHEDEQRTEEELYYTDDFETEETVEEDTAVVRERCAASKDTAPTRASAVAHTVASGSASMAEEARADAEAAAAFVEAETVYSEDFEAEEELGSGPDGWETAAAAGAEEDAGAVSQRSPFVGVHSGTTDGVASDEIEEEIPWEVSAEEGEATGAREEEEEDKTTPASAGASEMTASAADYSDDFEEEEEERTEDAHRAAPPKPQAEAAATLAEVTQSERRTARPERSVMVEEVVEEKKSIPSDVPTEEQEEAGVVEEKRAEAVRGETAPGVSATAAAAASATGPSGDEMEGEETEDLEPTYSDDFEREEEEEEEEEVKQGATEEAGEEIEEAISEEIEEEVVAEEQEEESDEKQEMEAAAVSAAQHGGEVPAQQGAEEAGEGDRATNIVSGMLSYAVDDAVESMLRALQRSSSPPPPASLKVEEEQPLVLQPQMRGHGAHYSPPSSPGASSTSPSSPPRSPVGINVNVSMPTSPQSPPHDEPLPPSPPEPVHPRSPVVELPRLMSIARSLTGRVGNDEPMTQLQTDLDELLATLPPREHDLAAMVFDLMADLIQHRQQGQVSVNYLPQLFSRRPPLTRRQLLEATEEQLTQALSLHSEPPAHVFRRQLGRMLRDRGITDTMAHARTAVKLEVAEAIFEDLLADTAASMAQLMPDH